MISSDSLLPQMRQLKVASRGWRRAAMARARDMSKDLADFPLHPVGKYEPPSDVRRKAEAKNFLVGKY